MDTVKAGFLGGTLQIVFDMVSPTKAEIESVRNKNPLKIAYTLVDSVLFFCIKPNGMDYQDAPAAENPPTANGVGINSRRNIV